MESNDDVDIFLTNMLTNLILDPSSSSMETHLNSDISNNTIDLSGNTDLSGNPPPTYNTNIISIINRLRSEIPGINIVQSPHSSNLQNVMLNTLNQKNKYKNVVSEEGKNKLEFLTYKPDIHVEKKCPILQVPFEEGDEIAKLPCGHIFDKSSILQWLESESNKCPVCRYELDSQEKEVEKPNLTQPRPRHPYGSVERRRGFASFLNRYYEAQEERMIQAAIEQSLISLNNPTQLENNEVLTDDEELIHLLSDSDDEDDELNNVD